MGSNQSSNKSDKTKTIKDIVKLLDIKYNRTVKFEKWFITHVIVYLYSINILICQTCSNNIIQVIKIFKLLFVNFLLFNLLLFLVLFDVVFFFDVMVFRQIFFLFFWLLFLVWQALIDLY